MNALEMSSENAAYDCQEAYQGVPRTRQYLMRETNISSGVAHIRTAIILASLNESISQRSCCESDGGIRPGVFKYWTSRVRGEGSSALTPVDAFSPRQRLHSRLRDT